MRLVENEFSSRGGMFSRGEAQICANESHNSWREKGKIPFSLKKIEKKGAKDEIEVR